MKPDVTVAKQQLTITTLSADRVASVTVHAHDRFCAPVPNMAFALTGTKLIGTLPNVPKYSQNLVTGANGSLALNAIEWDTYTLRPTDAVWDIAGTPSSMSFSIDPGGALDFVWYAEHRSGNGVSLSITNPAGQPLDGAVVHITGTGYNKSATTGQSALDIPGPLTMTAVNGVYATGSAQVLESQTFDMGSSAVTLKSFSWTPATQDIRTGPNSVRFQVAANNDNATWNYIDPAGIAGLSGNRYFRYKVFLSTADPTVSPVINTISVGFSSACLAPGNAYLNGLSSGTYTLSVSLPGYQSYSAPLVMTNPWQSIEVTLSP